VKAVVIFDTLYGNTESVSRALAKGLNESLVETTCANIKDVSIEDLAQADLIAIGGPTHHHGASKPMKRFLAHLKGADLKGKHGFAFDTRVDSFWSGSAAKAIEKALKRSGAQVVRPPASAFVKSTWVKPTKLDRESESKEDRRTRRAMEVEERRASVVLEDGSQESFEKIGAEIGKAVISGNR
jgi:flavorubredoxin